MSNRRRLVRERLEFYLVHLLLAFYAIAVMIAFPPVGVATVLPAFYLLLLGNSYNVTVYMARLEHGQGHSGGMTTDSDQKVITA